MQVQIGKVDSKNVTGLYNKNIDFDKRNLPSLRSRYSKVLKLLLPKVRTAKTITTSKDN